MSTLAGMIAVMLKSLKRITTGVWALLLVAVIVDFINRWLGENYFSDPNITIVFNLAASIVQQHWFQFALVFLTGIIIGISLDWFDRKSDENKASEFRALGSKFRILADTIKGSSGWPNNIGEHKADILSALISAKKFDLWVPDERVYQLPDASFLSEYFKFIGRLLEDGHFDEARREALAWKPFLYKRSNS